MVCSMYAVCMSYYLSYLTILILCYVSCINPIRSPPPMFGPHAFNYIWSYIVLCKGLFTKTSLTQCGRKKNFAGGSRFLLQGGSQSLELT